MNIEKFKNEVVGMITVNVDNLSLVKFGDIEFDEVLNEEDDSISGTVKLKLGYGNCNNEHIFNVGWNSVDGFGLEDSDGEIYEASGSNIISNMYFDLALKDLDDEFLL